MKSFEERLGRLESLSQEIRDGDLSLEDAIKLFEEGMKLSKSLEKELSKDRIFHLYLNIIEMGPGIFGVEAASNAYFGKSVAALNLEEIVRLVAVIPKPLTAHPSKKDSWLKWRARWILDTLKRYNYINTLEHRMQIHKFQ